MERNEFLEKCKRNWKKVLIIGAASYLALTFISTAVVSAFISDKAKKIDNCEDEIGQEFQARKADFYDRYYDNWEKGLQKMEEGFARTHKLSDRNQIKGMKSVIVDTEEEIKALRNKPNKQNRLQKLEAQLPKRNENLAIMQATFDKKWTPQQENESLEEYERRYDEAEVDWYAIQVSRRIDSLEWYPDQRESILEKLEEHRERLLKSQEEFLAKYGETYEGKEFKELCAVLQEQARQETQEFLASVAEAEAAAEKRADLIELIHKRDELVRKEAEIQRFTARSPFRKIRALQKMLPLYSEYNNGIAAFEEKWGIEAEGPLKEVKADWYPHQTLYTWGTVDWGDAPVDYLAKEADLRERLPGVEKAFDAQFIAALKEKITDCHQDIQEKQQKIERMSNTFGNRNTYLALEKELAATKSKKLQIESSLSLMEEAFAEKWTPQKEAETIEQFKKRRDQANIQFLTALKERLKRDLDNVVGNISKKIYLEKTALAVVEALKEEEKIFSKKYGISCQQANIACSATN
jgi:hypothetical protein